MNKTEVERLIADLVNAARAYYQKLEVSPYTDEEFDTKLEFLEQISTEPEFLELFKEGTTGAKLIEGDPSLGSFIAVETTHVHDVPMLSLGKAKNEKELETFYKRATEAGARDFKLQAKLDGLALSAKYVNGKLERLTTRGDGEIGEDISYLMTAPNLGIVGLPHSIDSTDTLEVRGELFIDTEQFKAANKARLSLQGAEFKNPRNAIVGLMKKSKIGLEYPVNFTFSSYSLVQNKKLADLEILETLKSPDGKNFVTVDSITKKQLKTQKASFKITGFSTRKDLFESVKKFGEARAKFEIPTDGVVIKPTNEAEMHSKMGNTHHHPISQIAYKYPGESAISSILSMSVTVGKTGKLTPIAHINPVYVSGTLISNISCNNFNWCHERTVRVGSTISVTRANDVIPFINTVISNREGSENITVPTNCASCDTVLAYDKKGEYPPKTLLCPNVDCPSRDFFALKAAVGKNFLDIDGLAEATLEFLHETGRVNDISDFYTLNVDELKTGTCGLSKDGNPRMLGEKRATNIINHIEKSKSAPMWKILASLNISGLGHSNSKEFCRLFETVERIQEVTVEEITALNGFADLTARKIVGGLALRKSLISRLQSHGVLFTNDLFLQAKSNETGKLQGVSFAISGEVPNAFSNRGDFVTFVEENGGEFHSSPKATTSYMIGDKTSSSTKAKKATSLGIEFMTSEEFVKTFVN